MSIMYCEKHDRRWDSDKLDECPECENEPQVEKPFACFGEALTMRCPGAQCAKCADWQALNVTNTSRDKERT